MSKTPFPEASCKREVDFGARRPVFRQKGVFLCASYVLIHINFRLNIFLDQPMRKGDPKEPRPGEFRGTMAALGRCAAANISIGFIFEANHLHRPVQQAMTPASYHFA